MTDRKATHHYKKEGLVVFLESTAGLAKVHVPANGNEFWVKLADLTPIMDSVIREVEHVKKRLKKSRSTASPDSRYRVVRAA